MNNMKTAVQKISGFFLSLDKVSKFIILVGLFISFYSFFFFMSNKIYLIGSDAFYYISIADSIVKYSEMEDITTIPSFPIKTPQNGIVFLHVILSLLGISAKGRILTIVVINYLLYLSGVYPLYKIAGWIGLRKGLSLAALLSVYMGAWHIYRINLLAINDGIFNSLTLWFVYIVIKFVRDIDGFESKFLNKKAIYKTLIIYFFITVLIQFRLNAALLIGSAIISAILARKIKAFMLLLTGGFLLFLTFISIYSIVEVPSLESSGVRRLYRMFWEVYTLYNVKVLLWKILPILVSGLSRFNNLISALIFSIFPLSMIYCGYKGIKNKNFYILFIAIICLSGLWFTLSFPRTRYILYSFPFIYLILLSFKKIRLIGYGFVLFVFLQSMQNFYIGFSRGPESKLNLFIYEQNISLPENALLSSYNRRHPYFILGTRNYLGDDNWDSILKQIEAPGKFMPKLTLDLIINNGSLFVLGNSTYIDSTYSQVNEMAINNGYMLHSSPLTPPFDEFDGWALVELNLSK